MVICTIPLNSHASCEWMRVDESDYVYCAGVTSIAVSCPNRKIIDDKPKEHKSPLFNNPPLCGKCMKCHHADESCPA